MDKELKSKVEANRIAIMALIQASGPQTLRDITFECAIHANGNNSVIHIALSELEKQGAVFRNIEDGQLVWEEPDEAWPAKD